jgi:transcriptional regulator with XRE-family HTH domain
MSAIVNIEDLPAFRAINVTPGEVLAIYRGNHKLTLQEVANLSGISRRLLSAMEHGNLCIEQETAQKLASVFACPYSLFL